MRVFCVWSVLKKIIPIQTYNWLTAAITKFYGHFGVEWTFRLGRYFLGHPIKIATIIFWNEPKWIITIVSRKWNWVIHFLCIEYHMWHLARSLSISFLFVFHFKHILRNCSQRCERESRIGYLYKCWCQPIPSNSLFTCRFVTFRVCFLMLSIIIPIWKYSAPESPYYR